MRVYFTGIDDESTELVSHECTKIEVTETGLELYNIFTGQSSDIDFKKHSNITIAKV